jgi:hypothetical protein
MIFYMIIEESKKDEILLRAKELFHYNNLLIEQCDNWLSAEEGNRIMMERITERKQNTTDVPKKR